MQELGLVPALEALADSWRSDQPGTELDLTLNITGQHLDQTTSLTVYRVVQEGLTNAYRHARATRISANIMIRDTPRREIAVVISDNGDGIAGPPEDGFGLRGMRERVGALGGQLTIGQQRSGGTIVHATIPLSST